MSILTPQGEQLKQPPMVYNCIKVHDCDKVSDTIIEMQILLNELATIILDKTGQEHICDIACYTGSDWTSHEVSAYCSAYKMYELLINNIEN